jgi:hypothetical protein
MRDVEHGITDILCPFVCIVFPAIGAYPTTATESYCPIFGAIGAIIDEVTGIIIIAYQHLLYFFHFNVP